MVEGGAAPGISLFYIHIYACSDDFIFIFSHKLINVCSSFCSALVKFLEVIKPFCSILPEIAKPERKVRELITQKKIINMHKICLFIMFNDIQVLFIKSFPYIYTFILRI